MNEGVSNYTQQREPPVTWLSDFCLQGGVKVLITGPWTEAAEHYSCVFDHIAVPASLVQPGVLRCYCPGMGTGGGRRRDRRHDC